MGAASREVTWLHWSTKENGSIQTSTTFFVLGVLPQRVSEKEALSNSSEAVELPGRIGRTSVWDVSRICMKACKHWGGWRLEIFTYIWIHSEDFGGVETVCFPHTRGFKARKKGEWDTTFTLWSCRGDKWRMCWRKFCGVLCPEYWIWLTACIFIGSTRWVQWV